jgi:hypothetical protein
MILPAAIPAQLEEHPQQERFAYHDESAKDCEHHMPIRAEQDWPPPRQHQGSELCLTGT